MSIQFLLHSLLTDKLDSGRQSGKIHSATAGVTRFDFIPTTFN